MFPSHLNNVSILPCETWHADRTRATTELLREETSRIYSTLTVAPKYARFESSWLQLVRSIARESVQNTRHWSERNKTATENGERQAG